MKIVCRSCKRPMSEAAFAADFIVFLGKKFGDKALELVIHSIFNYFVPSRGRIEDIMALFANRFAFECPNCQKVTCWDGTPDDEVKSTGLSLDCDSCKDDEDVVSF